MHPTWVKWRPARLASSWPHAISVRTCETREFLFFFCWWYRFPPVYCGAAVRRLSSKTTSHSNNSSSRECSSECARTPVPTSSATTMIDWWPEDAERETPMMMVWVQMRQKTNGCTAVVEFPLLPIQTNQATIHSGDEEGLWRRLTTRLPLLCRPAVVVRCVDVDTLLFPQRRV